MRSPFYMAEEVEAGLGGGAVLLPKKCRKTRHSRSSLSGGKKLDLPPSIHSEISTQRFVNLPLKSGTTEIHRLFYLGAGNILLLPKFFTLD